MRLLSRKEFNLTEGASDIPIDLRESYFPAMFHVKGALSPEYSRGRVPFDDDDARCVFDRIADALNVHRLLVAGAAHGHPRELHKFQVSFFDIRKGEESQPVFPAYGLVALDHLLSRAELQELNIDPKPGYLYLGVQASFAIGPGDRSGSRCLSEEGYYQTYNEYLATMQHRRWEVDTLPDDAWRGHIADVEHSINGVTLYSSPGIRLEAGLTRSLQRRYVVVTPLDLPLGFVTDTAFRLHEMRKRLPRVAQLFNDCVFNAAKAPPSTSAYTFPHGDLPMSNERAWVNSSRPWLVQHILFARIVGGAYWKYNLQRYELDSDALESDLAGPSDLKQ
jgi:hypothetical protein